jgi:aryl-alcohol dehydrogenase-like predicted oxidoreductase
VELISLGSTGLRVPRVGLGLAALGRPGYINLGHAADLHCDYDVAVMETQARAVLDAAWNLGIRYVDAARSYGLAEAFLARWLAARQINPHEITVGSKWGYTYTAEWKVEAEKHEIKNHSVETLRRQIAESRALLGSYLALYQIHSATLESGVLDDVSVHDELARLRETGVKIGLTLTGPRQAKTLRRALAVRVAGVPLFDCVQATWNLLEPSAGAALGEARVAGLGIIIKEALANGRLTSRNDDPEFAAKRRLLEGTAARLGTSLDALALAAALAQPWAEVVLSGAATVDQLQSNANAERVMWDGQASAALTALAETPEEYWGKRVRLPWN